MGLKATVAEDSRDPGGEAPLPGLNTGWECSLDLAGVGEDGHPDEGIQQALGI